MRCLIKATLPNEATNRVIAEGRLPELMQSILGSLRPESAYFTTENGLRCAYIVTDIVDQAQLPAITEPFYLAFNAQVEVMPAMSAEDLGRAIPAIESAVRQYAPRSGAYAR